MDLGPLQPGFPPPPTFNPPDRLYASHGEENKEEAVEIEDTPMLDAVEEGEDRPFVSHLAIQDCPCRSIPPCPQFLVCSFFMAVVEVPCSTIADKTIQPSFSSRQNQSSRTSFQSIAAMVDSSSFWIYSKFRGRREEKQKSKKEKEKEKERRLGPSTEKATRSHQTWRARLKISKKGILSLVLLERAKKEFAILAYFSPHRKRKKKSTTTITKRSLQSKLSTTLSIEEHFHQKIYCLAEERKLNNNNSKLPEEIDPVQPSLPMDTRSSYPVSMENTVDLDDQIISHPAEQAFRPSLRSSHGSIERNLVRKNFKPIIKLTRLDVQGLMNEDGVNHKIFITARTNSGILSLLRILTSLSCWIPSSLMFSESIKTRKVRMIFAKTIKLLWIHEDNINPR